MGEEASAENVRVSPEALAGLGPMYPRFSNQPVSNDNLEWLVDVTRMGSAEWNFQSRRWIVVRSETAKRRLEAASLLKIPLRSAPVILICLSDTLAWKSAPQRLQEMVASRKITEEEGREVLRQVQEYYSSSPEVAQRTAVANGLVGVQQALLGAAACGLSAYWITAFDEVKIKAHFHIPDQFTVAALVPIGYREDAPTPGPPLKPNAQQFVYHEKFGKVLDL